MKNISGINKTFRKLFQDTTYIHILAFVTSFSLKKLINFIVINIQYLTGSLKLSGYPYTLTIDTSNICNLKCTLCPSGNNEINRPKGMMTLKDFKRYFDIFKDYIFILNLYAWGEPFLTKDIFSIIKYSKKNNVFVSISTNFNIPNNFMKKMIDSGVDHLIIGLDGADKKTYNKYRMGGDFDKVIKNIKELVRLKKMNKRKKPIVQLQCLVFKHNQDQISRVIQLAQSLGVDFVDFLKGGWSIDESYMSNLKGLQERDTIKLSRCIYPWNKIAIFSDGGVAPCCYTIDKNDDLGNMNEDDFRIIWDNEKFIQLRKQHNNPKRIIKGTICSKCLRFKS